MPAEPNKALRIVVPIIAVAIGVGLAIGVGSSTKRQTTPTPAAPASVPVTASESSEQPEAIPVEGQIAATPEPVVDAASQAADGPEPVPATSVASTQAPIPAAGTLVARTYAGEVGPVVLGSLDAASGFELEVQLTPFGAGIAKATTTNHFETVEDRRAARANPAQAKNHYVVQQMAELPGVNASNMPITYRMSAMGVTAAVINGQRIELFGGSYGRVWELQSSSSTTAEWTCEIVESATGAPVATLRRLYSLAPGSFDVFVEQTIENHSGAAISVVWEQFGALDLPNDVTGYRIPMQRVRVGYFRASQPTMVHADGKLLLRSTTLTQVESALDKGLAPNAIWPARGYPDAGPLVWAAQTNRYFMAGMHALPAPAATITPELPVGGQVLPSVLWDDQKSTDGDRLALRHASPVFQVAPGTAQALNVGFYAAPIDDERLNQGEDQAAAAAKLQKIVVYNMGGWCAWCTFPWLASLLLWVLRFFDTITGDWAISIILLVVCVRSLLHPIFKRSQVGIQRFGKQMQRIAPKQKKLQEKFKDDPKRLHAEVRNLMREEKVSYAGLFGCLPMFLQSPIWIALYAMLYCVWDLRHEAAFFGVFQQLGGWGFLSDLSQGDRFIPLPKSVHFDMPLMGTITAINILPLLLGVVFYVHQKYLTPPPSATMTPEQEQTQKIMKVMMVVMFPVFMYNAPAALSLYFVTNSALGIIESKWIRAHVDALELDVPGGPGERKKVENVAGGKPTLEERLRARLEAKRPPKKPQ